MNAIVNDMENVQALVAAWRHMVERFPNHRIIQGGGVSSILSLTPLSFFNMVVLDQPATTPAALRAALGLAARRLEVCRHSAMLAICPAWSPESWEELVREAGLAPALNITGMATDDLAAPRRPAPDLEYRSCVEPAVASDLAVINAHAYGMPQAEFEPVAEPGLWEGRAAFGLVGYVKGRAVASTAAFVIGEMIYVAYVATLPEAHRQGYAEAVMREAIARAQAAEGRRRIWLHASDMGRPLYQSMGFETGSTLPLFNPAR